ncbi:hypothetical protein NOGI109294_17900 [Nocardiopsis gilva]
MVGDEPWRGQQLAVGRDGFGTARVGGGLGQQRPPRGHGQRQVGDGVVVSVTADDDAALHRWRRHGRGLGLRRRTLDPRSPVHAARQGFRPLLAAARPIRDERVAEGQVEVDRPGTLRVGRGPRTAGQRSPVGDHARQPLGRADLGEQAHGRSEELDLVDGLVGAGAAQLGWTVGGEHEQRHAALVGLQYRRVEVGRRCARGAHQGDGAPRGACQTEREEGRRALVDADVDPDPGVGDQGEREGRRTRPWRDDGLGQPASGQFIDEDPRQRG